MTGGPLGYVLSGATTRHFDFIVAEGAEDRVVEGKYVAARARSGASYLGLVDELVHRHEFYEEGDVWVEAIRRGQAPPEGVARRYIRARARIIGVVEGSGLRPAPRPPPPGTPVFDVSGRDLEPVYGYDPSREGDPEWAVSLGSLYGYTGEDGLRAPLDLRALTMHMAVVGTTGSGKSNTMGVLIEELGSKKGVDLGVARLPVTVPAVVVDLNGDYLDYYCDPGLVPSYRKVYRLVLERSPAYRRGARGDYRSVLAPIRLNLDELSGEELAEVIVTLYRRGPGEQTGLQEAVLAQLLDKEGEYFRRATQGLEDSYNVLFSSRRALDSLIGMLYDMASEGLVHRATAGAVARQLRVFQKTLLDYRLLPEAGEGGLDRDFIDEVTDPEEPSLVILDFSSEGAPAPLYVKQFIVYYLARLLFNSFVDYKMEGDDRFLLFVMEEAQNFAPNLAHYQIGFSMARSILYTVATQGRKFGLSLAIVTQRPKYVDPVVLSMMNTYIVHRVPPLDVGFVEQLAGGLPGGVARNLATMERGVAIVVGQMNPSPLPTIVRVRRRRRHGVAEGGVRC